MVIQQPLLFVTNWASESNRPSAADCSLQLCSPHFRRPARLLHFCLRPCDIPRDSRLQQGWVSGLRPRDVMAGPCADGDRFLGIIWKFARIGERLSPYISIACIIMAIRFLL